MTSDEKRFEAALAEFEPEIVERTLQVLARLRARIRGAVELVYDNYNALVVAFGPTERTSDAVLSVAVYPRWVTLFFLDGAQLDDPDGLLLGGGARVRRIVLERPEVLEDPRVDALVEEALARAAPAIDPGRPRRMLIRSTSAQRRPRRPR